MGNVITSVGPGHISWGSLSVATVVSSTLGRSEFYLELAKRNTLQVLDVAIGRRLLSHLYSTFFNALSARGELRMM